MKLKMIGRRIVATLGLILFASAALAQAAYRIQVDGLACPFCAYGIEKKLGAIAGVTRVETDIAAGTLSVTMAEGTPLDEATATRAVSEAGFSLRGFEALAPAALQGSRTPAQ